MHVTVSASGYSLPPFIIFENCFPSGPYGRNGPNNALYGISPNGYMDSELFKKWVEKQFLPQTHHLPRPLLLILDGHGSHMNIDMIDLLVENDVHLYCLPPHTTNILQPCDVAIFRPLKAYFSRLTDMVKLASLGTTNHVHISKKNFSAIFKEAFDKALVVSTIKKGFRKCGIMPFNPDAIDKNRLMPSHEGNEVSFEVEPTDTGAEADATEAPVQPAPTVEPDLQHPSLPGGSISISAVAASTSSDLRRLNPLIRNGLVPPSLVDCFIFPATPEKKAQSIRPVAKARVLTSVEQRKMFREKVEQKRVEEERKEKRMQEREKKRNEKAKSKKNITEKKKATKEKVSQRNETSGTNEEKLQQLKPREKRKRKKPARFYESSDSSDNIMEESVEEYIGTSEEEGEERCFSCKKANVRGSASKEVEWVACDLCEKWYHVICEGACDEDLVSENYTCKLCCLV